VVAERDHVCTSPQEGVGELRGDPRSVGDVLAVDDAEVGLDLVAQRRQPLVERTPSGDPEDVGEEKELQLRTSADAGRISTETWLPASFV
jgi:hypothetical protein